jgi:hypothetical protein
MLVVTFNSIEYSILPVGLYSGLLGSRSAVELFRFLSPVVDTPERVSNKVTQLRSNPGVNVGLNWGKLTVALGKLLGATVAVYTMVVAGIPPEQVHWADELWGIDAAMKTIPTMNKE